MSWKSFVSAGLLCVLASPAFADPTVSGAAGGNTSSNHLDANGNWVWDINILPDYSLVSDNTGTPIAAELGFTSSATGGGSATVSTAARGADMVTNATHGAVDANPGNQIFTWEATVNLGGGGDCSGPSPGVCPTGVQVGGPSNTQVFSALGSDNETAGNLEYLVLTVGRPVTTAAGTPATTTIALSGAYAGTGRIAQINDPTPGPPYDSQNYDGFTGSVMRQAYAGDANLDGDVGSGDYSILLTNFANNDGMRDWNHADFNGDGDVGSGDYSLLLANFNTITGTGQPTYSVLVDGSFPGGGGGAGGGAVAAPEPASVALLALAALGVAGLRFRRRA